MPRPTFLLDARCQRCVCPTSHDICIIKNDRSICLLTVRQNALHIGHLITTLKMLERQFERWRYSMVGKNSLDVACAQVGPYHVIKPVGACTAIHIHEYSGSCPSVAAYGRDRYLFRSVYYRVCGLYVHRFAADHGGKEVRAGRAGNTLIEPVRGD